MRETDYSLAFSQSTSIGPKRFQGLLRVFGSAKTAWDALLDDKEDLLLKIKELGIGKKTLLAHQEFTKSFDFEKTKQELQKFDVKFISCFDLLYPPDLKILENPPIGLYVRGNPSLLNRHSGLPRPEPSRRDPESSKNLNGSSIVVEDDNKNIRTIGIVGTRMVTSYGREVTQKFAEDLVFNNFVIVSGMALGVDAISHEAAVKNNKPTIAILGCGVVCPFPSSNGSLYKEILKSGGCIISEYGLFNSPNKGTFPARNRIIAALSQGVMVTEAGEDSGSLITAKYAFELNKKVFAIPGPITSRLSDGTSYLIKNGGILVQNAGDILKECQISNIQLPISNKIDIESLQISDDEKKVLKLLQHEPYELNDLARTVKIPITELSQILSSLEMQGLIKNSVGEFSLAS